MKSNLKKPNLRNILIQGYNFKNGMIDFDFGFPAVFGAEIQIRVRTPQSQEDEKD